MTAGKATVKIACAQPAAHTPRIETSHFGSRFSRNSAENVDGVGSLTNALCRWITSMATALSITSRIGASLFIKRCWRIRTTPINCSAQTAIGSNGTSKMNCRRDFVGAVNRPTRTHRSLRNIWKIIFGWYLFLRNARARRRAHAHSRRHLSLETCRIRAFQ